MQKTKKKKRQEYIDLDLKEVYTDPEELKELNELLKLDTEKFTKKTSRHWFITINNSDTKKPMYVEGKSGSPPKLKQGFYNADYIRKALGSINTLRWYCFADEIGLEEGTYHTHIAFSCRSEISASTVAKLFYNCHRDPIHKTCAIVRDYVFKEGRYADSCKSETKVPGTAFEFGDVPGGSNAAAKAKASKMNLCLDLIREGKDLAYLETLDPGFFVKNKKELKDYYLRHIRKQYGYKRRNKVFYHMGEPGSGKSYSGEEIFNSGRSIFVFNDRRRGGLDSYEGQEVLFFDEVRGDGVDYATFLCLIGSNIQEIGARFANVLSLWTETHLTSVYGPEEIYEDMVSNITKKDKDNFDQFKRRLDWVVFHYAYLDDEENIIYKSIKVRGSQYTKYDDIKTQAEMADPDYRRYIGLLHNPEGRLVKTVIERQEELRIAEDEKEELEKEKFNQFLEQKKKEASTNETPSV